MNYSSSDHPDFRNMTYVGHPLKCRHCAHETSNVELKPVSQHMGAYCVICGRWIMWVARYLVKEKKGK